MPDAKTIVTDKIIESLEKGVAPWTKPWNPQGHKNLNSKRGYRGINRLLLEVYALEGEYESNFWCTYPGAQKKGGNVRKGEKANYIVFFKRIEVKDESDSDEDKKTIPLLRYYKVWNTDQCEGIELPTENIDEFLEDKHEFAGKICNEMQNAPKILHGKEGAFYSPPKDIVGMPKHTDFLDNDMANGSDSYYCTLFHELAHSTGHKDRLNRDELMKTGLWGATDYSKEELVAEISSAMLAAHCGLDPSNMDRSAAYVGSWLKKLNDDRKMIIAAAGKAQKAVDYILNVQEDENEQNSN